VRAQRGLTLVEVMLAAIVVGTVVVSAGWAVGLAVQSGAALQEESCDAALMAREVFELALLQDTADDGDKPADEAKDVTGLGSLDGASFCPPLDSSGAELPLASPELWRQDCDVQVYDLADLGAPVSEDFAGAAQGSSTLYRLTVSVSFRGKEQGAWWWWINP
jgi:type II secretory pathway pseudopilin PulG